MKIWLKGTANKNDGKNNFGKILVIIIEGFSLVNEWPELYFLDDKQIGFQQADLQTSGKGLGGMPC